MMRRAAWVLVTVAACSDAPYDGLLEPPPSDQGMQLGIKASVPPGQEVTVCKNFALPSGTFDIGRFEQKMSADSHHLLVYQVSIDASTITDDVIQACDENADAQKSRVGFIFGSQSETFDLALPEGIALSTSGGIAMQMEFHIVNSTDKPVDAEAALNLWKAHEPITGDAGVLLLYHNQIAIAPNSTATMRQRCPIKNDIQLAAIVPHMHSRGVGEQISLDTGTGQLQQLVDAQSWHADTIRVDPPLSIPAGSTIDYQCEFDNTTSNVIVDGPSARNNEMCVVGGLYYVPNGPRMNIADEVCFGKDIIYMGANTCSQVRQCVETIDYSTGGPADQFDLCDDAGCQTSVAASDALLQCEYNACRDQCYVLNGMYILSAKYTDPACTSCVQSSCSAQVSACATATCP